MTPSSSGQSASGRSSSPLSLPLRANLDWLKKVSKERLANLRAGDPAAKLSHAQLAVARDYGFPSWRKLKAHVEQVRQELDKLWPGGSAPPPDAPPVSPDDPDLEKDLPRDMMDGYLEMIDRSLDIPEKTIEAFEETYKQAPRTRRAARADRTD